MNSTGRTCFVLSDVWEVHGSTLYPLPLPLPLLRCFASTALPQDVMAFRTTASRMENMGIRFGLATGTCYLVVVFYLAGSRRIVKTIIGFCRTLGFHLWQMTRWFSFLPLRWLRVAASCGWSGVYETSVFTHMLWRTVMLQSICSRGPMMKCFFGWRSKPSFGENHQQYYFSLF